MLPSEGQRHSASQICDGNLRCWRQATYSCMVRWNPRFSSVAVIKYMAEVTLKEEGLLWLTIPGHSSLLWRSQGWSLQHQSPVKEWRGNKHMSACLLACLPICLLACVCLASPTSYTGNHATHHGLGLCASINHQDYTPNSCPDTPPGQPDLLTSFPKWFQFMPS